MKGSNFFDIYDTLIGDIPEDILVVDAYQHEYWTGIATESSLGLGMTVDIATRPKMMEDELIGRSIKELAELIKSWNLAESSYGLAAINSYYNSTAKAKELGLFERPGDAFDIYREEVRGKKVSVIGHFPFLERQLAPVCDLKIIERRPREGDYPDVACEYLLPQSDYVFMTSSTFVNKTIVRLLELSKNAKVIMVGPSTPMASKLLEYGIDDLSGFIPEDVDFCKTATSKPACRALFDGGKMVSLNKI